MVEYSELEMNHHTHLNDESNELEAHNDNNHKKKELINKIYELLSNNNKYIDTSYNYKMVLKINYKRSYFISDQGEFRATIDTEINTSPVLDFNKVIRLPETILEFKFSQISESYFRDFFSLRGLNIRSKKYSKYIQSFIALEESGLIS